MIFKSDCNARYRLPIVVCGLLIFLLTFWFLFGSLSRSKESTYLYIDADDTVDSVCVKLRPYAHKVAWNGFSTLARHLGLGSHLRPGRYVIEPGEGAVKLFRRIRSGSQSPVRLIIPSVRTVDRLAGYLGKTLMVDSVDWLAALTNPDTCRAYERDTATMIAMFLPNTYEVYWTTSINQLLQRMQRESDAFWTDVRRDKAAQLNLTPDQVITLASIVDEETNAQAEKPAVAGMYYNRLQQGMPLQADPTVKFALKNFEARRVYRNMLSADSPYNTYRYAGLPPGPIRIPTLAGIDAVLNLEHHDYLYMCASPTFDGTHRFARTYAEHQINARAYTNALNDRGIH